MRILGIDLGHINRPSAWHLVDTESGEVRRGTAATTTTDLEAVVAGQQATTVVIEACSAAYVVQDLFADLDSVEVVAVSTNDDAFRWRSRKRKTDQDDAERLVTLYRLGQFRPVWIPDATQRGWRRMIHHRHALVRRRTAVRNALRHAVEHHAPERRPRGAWSQQTLAALETLVAPAGPDPADWWRHEVGDLLAQHTLIESQLAQCERVLDRYLHSREEWRLLRSIPGVGRRLAEILLAFIGSADRFSSSKQVAAYAGLVPRHYESGATLRQGRITKAGNRLLRSMLVEVAWLAVRYNPWAREHYHRLAGNGTGRRKVAIVGVARKLLITCWAMLRKGQIWQEPAMG